MRKGLSDMQYSFLEIKTNQNVISFKNFSEVVQSKCFLSSTVLLSLLHDGGPWIEA